MLHYYNPSTQGYEPGKDGLNPDFDYGTPPSLSQTLVSIAVDGREITVPEGTSVLRAAALAGINIPKLCASDNLEAFGSCRLCAVEIEGRRGYPASCTTPVAEGMAVTTQTGKLAKLRRNIMELYISDHPMDCLTCPANGNCELQDVAGVVGLREVRYGFEGENHLDAETVAWLERYLHDFKGTIVAVTHDRYFLDNVAEWILELDRGHGIPWKGNYSSWLEQKEQRLAQESKQEQSHMKTIQHELEWVRSNAKGRRTKSKARLRQFEELQSKEFQKRNETNQIYIPPGPRLGESVIEFNHVSKAFGDKYLIEDLSFKVPQGAIVGIIGPNGAGKTTLFNMVNGDEQPDEGEITVGPTVELAYVSQSREDLNSDKQLWQEVADGEEVLKVGNYTIPARAWLSRFNFKGADQQKLVKHLSGGERNRLQLAKVLKTGGNVLLLDEPTLF